jgi:AraC-like DNA-binding protein
VHKDTGSLDLTASNTRIGAEAQRDSAASGSSGRLAGRLQVKAALAGMGPIADRTVPLGTLAYFGSWLGWQGWMRDGTSLEGGTGPLPDHLTVRDELIVLSNLVERVDAVELVEAMLRTGRPSASGLGLLAFSHAPTLGDSIRLAIDVLRFSTPYVTSSLENDGTTATVDLTAPWPLGNVLDFAGLFWMAFWQQAITGFQVLDFGKSALSLSVSPAGGNGRLEALFGCPVATGCDRNVLCFPAAWLHTRNPGHDPIIWALAEARTKAASAAFGEPDPASRIRATIVTIMDRDGRPPRMKQVALAHGLSTRTVVRMLNEAGTSFHALVEQERRVGTLQLLGNPALSIRDVADRMGFPDASSFGRKFRQWFGDSPARFRRAMHAGEGAADPPSQG